MKSVSFNKIKPSRIISSTMVLFMCILTFLECTFPFLSAAATTQNPYQPGTDDYYYYEFEKSKGRAGWLYETNLQCIDSDGNTTGTQNEGPWKLDLDYSETETGRKCSLPWDGSAVSEEDFDALPDVTFHKSNGEAVTGKKVFTAEQYRYAVANRRSFQLQNDIDLGGYLHTEANSRSWVTPGASTVKWAVDGGGHTVYNFYLSSSESNQSMFGQTGNFTLLNLRVSNAYVTSEGKVSALALFFTNAYYVDVDNCGAENTVVYLNSTSNYSAAIFACNIHMLNMNNSYTRNCHIMVFTGRPISCSAQMTMGGMSNNIQNSYAIDGTVIGNKGHNGGFASCLSYLNNNIKNCFSNIDVYGNVDAGAFIGVQHNGEHTVENCYATGKVEGTNRLGGFIGSIDLDGASAISSFKNSYSAAMVGMMSNASNQGGFMGSVAARAPEPGRKTELTIENCYAVGEVGSLDVDVSESRSTAYNSTGGFLGEYSTNETISVALSNCYYDKQTTAMREWAMGSDTGASAGYRAQDTASMGLKGVLTTDTTKAGAGLTSNPEMHSCGTDHTSCFTGFSYNSQWEFKADHFPQLKIFAEPNTANFKNTNWITESELFDLFKAYSQASVSTPKLQTYELDYAANPLPKETYDTIRDLTLDFHLSSEANSHWQKDGAVTKLFEESSVDVLNFIENSNGSGEWLANIVAPGIEWVTVQCTVGSQTGSKRLRIIPTASLDGGKNKKVKYGETYDHADDVRLAYSTGSRLHAANENWNEMGYGVTTGVFPDELTDDYQKQSQIPDGNLDHQPPGSNPPLTGDRLALFESQDDFYRDVDVSHLSKDQNDNAYGSKLNVSVWEIENITEAGEKILGGDMEVDNSKSNNPNNDLFNGHSPFDAGLGTQYLIQYTWIFDDGRYLEKSKVLTSSFKPAEISKTASVNGEDMETGDSDAPIPVEKGNVIEYSITVQNHEERETQTDVTITDVLPKGLTYLDSSDGGSHTVETESGRDVVTWNIAELYPKATMTFTVRAEVTGYGSFINYATIGIEDFGEIESNKTYHRAQAKVTFGFVKADAQTEEALGGAEFKLYLWEGGDAPEELVLDEAGESGWIYIGTQISDDETGLVEFEMLTPGEYRLVETKAPNEYQLPKGQWRFTISEAGEMNLLSSVGEKKPPDIKVPDTEAGAYLLLNAREVQVPFHFIKIDASTGTPIGGAQFELYLWEGGNEAPQKLVPDNLTDSGWMHIDTQISAAGTGAVDWEGLQPGTYQLAETRAPLGYQLPLGQWRFEITEDGELNILPSVGEYLPPAIQGEGTQETPYAIGNVVQYRLPEVGGREIWLTVMAIFLLAGSLLLTVLLDYGKISDGMAE